MSVGTALVGGTVLTVVGRTRVTAQAEAIAELGALFGLFRCCLHDFEFIDREPVVGSQQGVVCFVTRSRSGTHAVSQQSQPPVAHLQGVVCLNVLLLSRQHSAKRLTWWLTTLGGMREECT